MIVTLWKTMKLELNHSMMTEIIICPSYCVAWHNMSLMSHISLVLHFGCEGYFAQNGDFFRDKKQLQILIPQASAQPELRMVLDVALEAELWFVYQLMQSIL